MQIFVQQFLTVHKNFCNSIHQYIVKQIMLVVEREVISKSPLALFNKLQDK